MRIRAATDADDDAIWGVLEPMLRAGETYALPRDMSRADALAFWRGPGREAFVAVDDDDRVLGASYLRANQAGGGAHVANCGYVTAIDAQGRGVARALCLHSLDQAKARGFSAMQFNFVVSSNTRAVELWTSLGFRIVGTVPNAFAHPRLGFVDTFVMHRAL